MKTYSIDSKIQGDFVYIIASGARTNKNIATMASEVVSICKNEQVNKVLIDIRALKGRLSIFDSISIITKDFPVLNQLNVVSKLVVIDAEDNAERYRFFEDFARKRGYNVWFFSDADLATKCISQSEMSEA